MRPHQEARGIFNLDWVRLVLVCQTLDCFFPYLADASPVPAFGPRMVCTSCGTVGADVRPNWQERAGRESLTGVPWR